MLGLLWLVSTRTSSFHKFFIPVRSDSIAISPIKILRPIFTSTFSILNRRLLDLDDEWKNIRLKNAEDSTEKVFKQISEGIKRLTTEVFSKNKKTSQEEDLDPENITQHDSFEREGDFDEDQPAVEEKLEQSRTSKQRSSFEKSTSWFKEEVEMHQNRTKYFFKWPRI